LEEQATAKANADAEAALVAEDEAKKAAEQAAIVAAEAQLKVKEIEDKKQQELVEKNAADLQRSNDQQQILIMAVASLVICLAVGLAVWFWIRRNAKSKQDQATEKTNQASHTQTSAQVSAAQRSELRHQSVAARIVDKPPELALQSDISPLDDRPRFCGECGKKLLEDAKTCGACGAVMTPSIQPTIPKREVIPSIQEAQRNQPPIEPPVIHANRPQSVMDWYHKITEPVPLWVVYIINGIAWVLFILTLNHIVEFLMGVACIYAGVIAISKNEEKGARKLILASFSDAIWMFYWAFAAPMDDTSGVLDLLKHLGS